MRTRVRNLTAIIALTATVLGACSSSHDRSTPASASRATSAPTTVVRPPSATTLAAQAYVWGSPLVITERTLQTFGGLFGVNRVFSQSALSNASSRTVVAPNVDTLYSVAVVDLRGGPVVLHVPRITDKYWVYQFIDAWTDSFAYIGTRTTGGRAGTWLVAPAGWRGATPSGMGRITSPTPQLFLLGRWFVTRAVRRTAARGRAPHGDASTSGRGPTHAGDRTSTRPAANRGDGRCAILRRARRRARGERSRDHRGSPCTRKLRVARHRARPPSRGAGHGRGSRRAGRRCRGGRRTHPRRGPRQRRGRERLGESLDRRHLHRFARARARRPGRLGRQRAGRGGVPRALVDPDGRPLDGRHTYRMHFAAGASPPVRAFWSLTLYGPDQFLVDNPLHRFAISTRSPGFRRAADGSFDIWIGNRPPASGTSNWLPAPPGPFLLALRMYLPDAQVLAGRYVLPGVQRVG